MRNRFLRGLIPALALAALPAVSSAGLFIGVSVRIAPPPLPVYVQPPCPEPGYIWAPGYWAWNDEDGAYYWVPGTWVLPPQVGLLWTPGYWDWDDGAYIWHAGYWGPHVGFYGGVDYGFGYDGVGFVGGYWHGGVFFYNRAVVRVGPTFVRDVYYHPVVYRSSHEHVSFSGGPEGVRARPTREQMLAERERHAAFTPLQQRQQRMAFADHALRADYNHGRPPVAATARPAMFHGSGAFAAGSMRADRPSWATGQNHAMPRTMERSAGERGQPGFARAEQQHFDARAQRYNSEAQGNRYMGRPQAQPQPEFRQGFRPQQNLRPQQNFRPQQDFRPQPNFRPEASARPQQSFRPPQSVRPQQRGFAPQPQQRGGGERPHRPPEDRGHGR